MELEKIVQPQREPRRTSALGPACPPRLTRLATEALPDLRLSAAIQESTIRYSFT